jgi:hypothetical protein
MSSNPTGQVQSSAAIRELIRDKLIERRHEKRVWFL